jgi:hypothetical protein
MKIVEDMLRNWAEDELTIRKWSNEADSLAQSSSYKLAFKHRLKLEIKQIRSSDFYSISEKGSNQFLSNALLMEELGKLPAYTFDHMINISANCLRVEVNYKDWCKSKYSCVYYRKNYFCYHIVAVGVNLGLAEIPIQYQNDPLLQNKRPGRPKKAKGGEALLKEPEPEPEPELNSNQACASKDISSIKSLKKKRKLSEKDSEGSATSKRIKSGIKIVKN